MACSCVAIEVGQISELRTSGQLYTVRFVRCQDGEQIGKDYKVWSQYVLMLKKLEDVVNIEDERVGK